MTHTQIDHPEPPITDVVPISTGQRISVAVWPGDGPTFVFAPGLTSHNRNIAGVAAALDGSMPVVALDLRGRGNSTKPGGGQYGMKAHAEDVLAVMDALGIEQAVVGGHSMGAYVATAVAVQAPERCQGLVLIDGGVLLSTPEQPDADTLLDLALKPVIDRLDQVFPSVEAYRDFWSAGAYFELSPIAEHYLRYDLGVVPGGYQPKCARVAAVEDWRDLLTNPETIERLTRVTGPVLAIGAEEGLGAGQPPILGEEHLARLRSLLPSLEYVFVPGTTHHSITLSDEGARATTAALSAFVAGLPALAGSTR